MKRYKFIIAAILDTEDEKKVKADIAELLVNYGFKMFAIKSEEEKWNSCIIGLKNYKERNAQTVDMMWKYILIQDKEIYFVIDVVLEYVSRKEWFL